MPGGIDDNCDSKVKFPLIHIAMLHWCICKRMRTRTHNSSPIQCPGGINDNCAAVFNPDHFDMDHDGALSSGFAATYCNLLA